MIRAEYLARVESVIGADVALAKWSRELAPNEWEAVTGGDVLCIVAALQAVLSLCDTNVETDAGGLREWGDVPIVQIRRAINAALGVEP